MKFISRLFILYSITMIIWWDSIGSSTNDQVYGPGDDNYGRDRVGYMDEREKAFCMSVLTVIVRNEIPYLTQKQTELSPTQFEDEIQNVWSSYIRLIVGSKKNIPKEIREEFIELLLKDVEGNINWRDIPEESEDVAKKLLTIMQATYEIYKIESNEWVKWKKGKEMELHALLYRFDSK